MVTESGIMASGDSSSMTTLHGSSYGVGDRIVIDLISGLRDLGDRLSLRRVSGGSDDDRRYVQDFGSESQCSGGGDGGILLCRGFYTASGCWVTGTCRDESLTRD